MKTKVKFKILTGSVNHVEKLLNSYNDDYNVEIVSHVYRQDKQASIIIVKLTNTF